VIGTRDEDRHHFYVVALYAACIARLPGLTRMGQENACVPSLLGSPSDSGAVVPPRHRPRDEGGCECPRVRGLELGLTHACSTALALLGYGGLCLRSAAAGAQAAHWASWQDSLLALFSRLPAEAEQLPALAAPCSPAAGVRQAGFHTPQAAEGTVRGWQCAAASSACDDPLFHLFPTRPRALLASKTSCIPCLHRVHSSAHHRMLLLRNLGPRALRSPHAPATDP